MHCTFTDLGSNKVSSSSSIVTFRFISLKQLVWQYTYIKMHFYSFLCKSKLLSEWFNRSVIKIQSVKCR